MSRVGEGVSEEAPSEHASSHCVGAATLPLLMPSEMKTPGPPAPSRRPRVVILGAGFGGLNAAQGLRKAPVDVTLIDRTNHHLFQPLLYQVAAGVLSPSDIAHPIRTLLRRQRNAEVMLGDVASIDPERQVVILRDLTREIAYDYLILATGACHSYFHHPEWEDRAPGLKSLHDALEIRRRFVLALEEAERTEDPELRHALMTIVVVGAGPTGVELAGILPDLLSRGMRREFRHIDPSRVRVLLVEGGPRVLPTFDESLSERAHHDLQALGVEVRTDAIVTHVSKDAVLVGEERIATRTVLWAAGNQASPLTGTVDAPLDRAGRALVAPDLSLPDHPNVFVIGDAAAVPLHPSDEELASGSRLDSSGNEAGIRQAKGGAQEFVPAVAPAATQMGRHAAKMIIRSIREEPRTAFRYRDKGALATIGRNRAVAHIGRFKLTGRIAWFFWLFVHLMYLVGFRNRIIVFVDWAYAYFTYRPGARIVVGSSDTSEA